MFDTDVWKHVIFQLIECTVILDVQSEIEYLCELLQNINEISLTEEA
jgi:hypothetical protein